MRGRKDFAPTGEIGFVETAVPELDRPSPSFSWIWQIPPEAWSPVIRGVRWVQMPRLAFAMKCGLPNDGRIDVAFRTWARHQQCNYSLKRDLPLDPTCMIRIVERIVQAPGESQLPGRCQQL